MDRKQTHLTLRPYLLEEAYETVDAIEHGTSGDLAEELGDLLLQVILHAQFAAEEGEFDLTDVYRSIAGKIVRRHPHVFGDVTADGVEQVLRNWETIKADERAERGKERADAFGGSPARAGAAGQPRDPGARIGPGWDWDAIAGCGRRWRRSSRSCGPPRPTRRCCTSSATSSSRSSTSGAG